MPTAISYYQKHKFRDGTPSLFVPWQKIKKQILWDEVTLKLYRDNDVLKHSVDLLIDNKAREVVSILKSHLDESGKDKSFMGKLHNNLSIGYLLLSPSQPQKAKYHIDQAGILLSSPTEVLENTRTIAYFLQGELRFRPK